MKEPRWVSRMVVEILHQEQLEEHGGLPGLRDEGALESALGKPRNKWGYEKREKGTDLSALAAAYGYGIARNHPFNDGNKRTAFLTMAAFLSLNGYEFNAPEADVVTVMTALAAGQLSEPRLALWIRQATIKTRDAS